MKTATPATFSASELARSVNDWCREHGVVPLTGQANPEISERNVRFYRAQGLLEAPTPGLGFTEKHRQQLITVRVLQANGLPLRHIQELLYGRSEDDLRAIQQRALAGKPGPGAFASTQETPAGGLLSEAAPAYSFAKLAAEVTSPIPGVPTSPAADVPALPQPPSTSASWAVHTLSDEFLVISRQGRAIDPEKLRRIAEILRA